MFPFHPTLYMLFHCQGYLMHLSYLVLEIVKLLICHMIMDVKNGSAKVPTFCIIFIESKLSSVVKCDTFTYPKEKKMLPVKLRYTVRL